MLFLLKLIITWLIVGFTCTAITVLHDIVICRIEVGKRELKGMLAMICLGFISVPIIVYFFFDEYKDKFKRR